MAKGWEAPVQVHDEEEARIAAYEKGRADERKAWEDKDRRTFLRGGMSALILLGIIATAVIYAAVWIREIAEVLAIKLR